MSTPEHTVSLPADAVTVNPPAGVGLTLTHKPPAPASPPDGTPPLPPGYEFVRELGRGGMGVVYLARHARLNRDVALKMMLAGGHASHAQGVRFLAEGEAIARLDHPNVVRVYDLGSLGGQPFMALEYCPGGSLADALRGEPMEARKAAEVCEKLARGVAAAHAAGVIHRDLKPANVLLDAAGVPKVTDFGLAKLGSESGLTTTGAVFGSPSYMAPEQAAGDTQKIGPLSDVYALGAVLYECLTGRPPFRGLSVPATLAMVQGAEAVRPSRLVAGVYRDLETICLKCLQKDPGRRYAGATALANDLKRFLSGEPIAARRAGAPERVLHWCRREPAKATATALALGCVASVAVAALLYADNSSRDARASRRILILTLSGEVERLLTSAQAASVRGDADAAARDAAAAATLAGSDPELLASELGGRAERARAGRAAMLANRARLVRVQECLARAMLARTNNDASLADSTALVRAAVAEGLSLLGIDAAGSGPPPANPLLEAAEAERGNELCAELLFLDADALAQPQPGERIEQWRGRLAEALAQLDRLDRLGSSASPGALRLRADCLRGTGDAAAADTAAEKAKTISPVSASDLFLNAIDLYRRGEFRAARGSLVEVLRRRPDHFNAQSLLGYCMVREKLWAGARDAFARCVEMQPGFAWGHALRGLTGGYLGDYDAAESDFARALEAAGRDRVTASAALTNRAVMRLRSRFRTRLVGGRVSGKTGGLQEAYPWPKTSPPI